MSSCRRHVLMPSPHPVPSLPHHLPQLESADRMGNKRKGRREERAQRGREGERERGGNGEVERGRKRGRREKGRCKEGGAKRRADHTNTSAFHAHLHTCTDTGPKASADSVSCLSLSLALSRTHTQSRTCLKPLVTDERNTGMCSTKIFARLPHTTHTHTPTVHHTDSKRQRNHEV